ncbi:hypothetical protein Pse7429DRAFT_1589 [Pseudanabaena biceps PCC 7429]|uniref:Uncharacterized protein n=2 Tax=Pseudanabaena TaxID=1152 RepID=L8N3F7_9CYAN|nr:hypothetical protein Pse7429DRAFT_1589 [Pseudanabaena biceps PCC 7429]
MDEFLVQLQTTFPNPWFNYSVILILYISISLSFSYIRSWFIINGKMPQAVVDFPIYETTPEEFASLKQKFEEFLQSGLENGRSELILTVEQLNCIICRGITQVKVGGGTRPGPIYYEIDNQQLIERSLSYPNLGCGGYQISTRIIEFAGNMCCIESLSSDSSFPSISLVGQFTPFAILCNVNSKEIEQFSKKITLVEIVDNKIVMRI